MFRLQLLDYPIDAVLAMEPVELDLPSSTVRIKPRHKAQIHPREISENFDLPYHVVQHDSPEAHDIIKSREIDLGIITGARILEKETIDLFDCGIINFHPGLIPEVRGLDALKWSIYHGIAPGVTSHLIDQHVDAGSVLIRREISVYEDDTPLDLSHRLYETELKLIEPSIREAIEGNAEPVDVDPDDYNQKMSSGLEEETMEKFASYKQTFLRDRTKTSGEMQVGSGSRRPRVAVLGCGYWGPNLIRNYNDLGALEAVCDVDKNALDSVRDTYPNATFSSDPEWVLENEHIDAVVLATPAETHYDLARKALEAGKHVHVEKPMAFTLKRAKVLDRMARDADLRFMVGHILLYHPAVKKLQEEIRKGTLGDIRYAYSTRVNLGIIRPEANVLWNLVVHDLAVILQMFEGNPRSVSVYGRDFIQEDVEDVAFMSVGFDTGELANFRASWLDPNKIRRLTVVGQEKMAVFDDMVSRDKLAIHNKGVGSGFMQQTPDTLPKSKDMMTSLEGDTVLPVIPSEEPLKNECAHFLDCIQNQKSPLTDSTHGVRVTNVLEAANKSIERGGERVSVEEV